jgi:hypothetical protein
MAAKIMAKKNSIGAKWRSSVKIIIWHKEKHGNQWRK